LPFCPTHLILDGGIARDGIIVDIQEQVSGISCSLQSPYDGTALGTALLVFNSQKLG